MKIRLSPIYSGKKTHIKIWSDIDLLIDGELYEFDDAIDGVYESIAEETKGVILSAFVLENELHVEIRRFYDDAERGFFESDPAPLITTEWTAVKEDEEV